LIGVQVCENPRAVTESATLRIARGFLDLASLALSNARLVDELERSNTVKTYYAATMTHELRNTLFAIGGLAEMLADKLESGQAELSRLANAIHERTHDSLAVIQASLELTSSDVRRTDDSTHDVAVPELLGQIAREVHVPGGKTNLRVEWDLPENLPSVRTDTIKLAMILRNLINNAIKFTDEGYVRVSVRPVEGALLFVVSDTGIGIASADLANLFEPFRQAHGVRSRRAGGAGLGLYIVGRLVELLGGRIGVESEASEGTRFTLTLPLRPPDAG
jgi:signal transduction histidine kinase